MLYYIVLYYICIILYYIILYYIVFYCIITLYYIQFILYYIILHYTILYYVVLYCIVFYYIILHYIILYIITIYIYIHIHSHTFVVYTGDHRWVWLQTLPYPAVTSPAQEPREFKLWLTRRLASAWILADWWFVQAIHQTEQIQISFPMPRTWHLCKLDGLDLGLIPSQMGRTVAGTPTLTLLQHLIILCSWGMSPVFSVKWPTETQAAIVATRGGRMLPNNQTPAGYASKKYGPPTQRFSRTIVCYEHGKIMFLDHLDLFVPNELQFWVHQNTLDTTLAVAGIVRSPLAAGTDLKKSEAEMQYFSKTPKSHGIRIPKNDIRWQITWSQAIETSQMAQVLRFQNFRFGWFPHSQSLQAPNRMAKRDDFAWLSVVYTLQS